MLLENEFLDVLEMKPIPESDRVDPVSTPSQQILRFVLCKPHRRPGLPISFGASHLRVIESFSDPCQASRMRVNLITQPSNVFDSGTGTIPLSLTIRPACGLPGDYEFPTDSAALLQLLRNQTDLPAYVLQRFEAELRARLGARLLGVDLSEKVLTDIGYFID